MKHRISILIVVFWMACSCGPYTVQVPAEVPETATFYNIERVTRRHHVYREFELYPVEDNFKNKGSWKREKNITFAIRDKNDSSDKLVEAQCLGSWKYKGIGVVGSESRTLNCELKFLKTGALYALTVEEPDSYDKSSANGTVSYNGIDRLSVRAADGPGYIVENGGKIWGIVETVNDGRLLVVDQLEENERLQVVSVSLALHFWDKFVLLD